MRKIFGLSNKGILFWIILIIIVIGLIYDVIKNLKIGEDTEAKSGIGGLFIIYPAWCIIYSILKWIF